MQHFYDGQIRRYTTQMMRILSNFPVIDGDGQTKDVPVMYGDLIDLQTLLTLEKLISVKEHTMKLIKNT